MRRTVVLLLCCLAAGVWMAPTQAVSPQSTRADRTAQKAIEQLERDRQDAFIRGDADALDRATAETYTTVSPGGVLADKAQMMKNIRARKTQVLSVSLEDLSARIYGDTAILTGIYRDTHITDGQKSEAHSRFIRVFTRTKDGWQAVAYQQTALPAR
jgi:ketosteroid isomerase-like protein